MSPMLHDLEGLNSAIVAIFVTVYVGMVLGGLPRLKLNRSGIALLGAIAVIGMGAISTEEAARVVDLPTMLLLFSFMMVSAQMRLGGFYTAVTRRVATLPLGRTGLLGAIIGVSGALSAIFSNDIICLAMTPVVVQLCLQRGLAPVPFLVGLACAANIGSAATLIGNPQNMLIGQTLHLSFARYLLQAGVPLEVIALWLGHEQPAVTHTYVQADIKMKQECMKLLEQPSQPRRKRNPMRFSRLLSFLEAQ